MSETDKQKSPENACEKVEAGGWIYFTVSSEYHLGYGNLYKVRIDGTDLTCLRYGLCEDLKIKDGLLHYTIWHDDDCYEGYTVQYIEEHCSIPLDE